MFNTMYTIVINNSNKNGNALDFLESAPMNWVTYMNKLKHIYFNRTEWTVEPFEDVTKEGLLHVIKSFLTYQGHNPKMTSSAGKKGIKPDIKCVINGKELSIIVSCIPVKERKYTYEFDRQAAIQPNGSIRFVADSAEDFLIFYDDSFIGQG